jgi:hypothetical protein
MLLQRQFQYLHIQCLNLQTTVVAVCTTCFFLCYGCTGFLCAFCDFCNKVEVCRKAVSQCLEWRLVFGGGPGSFNIMWTNLRLQVSRKSGDCFMYNQITVWPHGVFICLMLISGETAIISLHCPHWLVVISEMEHVYCVVRAECQSIIQFNTSFIRVIWLCRTLVSCSSHTCFVVAPNATGNDMFGLNSCNK